jgi:hypothetical protein
MNGPKKEGNYVDRDIDCQEALAQGVADLIDKDIDAGRSEAAAASEIVSGSNPGIDELIKSAIRAGWNRDEAAASIVLVAAGMHRGYTGQEPDE